MADLARGGLAGSAACAEAEAGLLPGGSCVRCGGIMFGAMILCWIVCRMVG